jgi:hypothetical protein
MLILIKCIFSQQYNIDETSSLRNPGPFELKAVAGGTDTWKFAAPKFTLTVPCTLFS